MKRKAEQEAGGPVAKGTKAVEQLNGDSRETDDTTSKQPSQERTESRIEHGADDDV